MKVRGGKMVPVSGGQAGQLSAGEVAEFVGGLDRALDVLEAYQRKAASMRSKNPQLSSRLVSALQNAITRTVEAQMTIKGEV